MKIQWQVILGLMLFALLASLTNAQSPEEDATDEADDSLIGDSESDESAPQAVVQSDYLNVGDYVRPPPPWWF
ncbi:hypothetical protein KR009_008330 [Drosophila setifemur]|nr:hypothetical protein KR009_008330 [Drosophila setifemur]